MSTRVTSRRHKTAHEVVVSLAAVARSIGRSPKDTRALLARTGYLTRRYERGRTTYDQRVIDVLHAVLGQPHRTLDPATSDWLAAYLKENQ